MIVDEKVGDIFEAQERYIAFAVNTQMINDSGLAGAMFRKYPVLKQQFPMGSPLAPGSFLCGIAPDKTAVLLVAHTLGEGWNHAKTQKAIDTLKEINDPIAIVKIGTGLIGQLEGADWSRIKKMLEDSPAKFVIYSLS